MHPQHTKLHICIISKQNWKLKRGCVSQTTPTNFSLPLTTQLASPAITTTPKLFTTSLSSLHCCRTSIEAHLLLTPYTSTLCHLHHSLWRSLSLSGWRRRCGYGVLVRRREEGLDPFFFYLLFLGVSFCIQLRHSTCDAIGVIATLDSLSPALETPSRDVMWLRVQLLWDIASVAQGCLCLVSSFFFLLSSSLYDKR